MTKRAATLFLHYLIYSHLIEGIGIATRDLAKSGVVDTRTRA